MIGATYDKDDPSTWKHWQTAEQKSTEEGRMTNPFASEDGRYDELSGRRFAIQTQPGGQWGSDPRESWKPRSNLEGIVGGTMMMGSMGRITPNSGTFYQRQGHNQTVWQAMQEIDHKYELADIKKRSQLAPIPGSQGSGRGYSSSTRGGRGSAPSNGLGITTGDIISNRGST